MDEANHPRALPFLEGGEMGDTPKPGRGGATVVRHGRNLDDPLMMAGVGRIAPLWLGAGYHLRKGIAALNWGVPATPSSSKQAISVVEMTAPAWRIFSVAASRSWGRREVTASWTTWAL